MSRLQLATRLSKELGTSVQNASRFIKDVGPRTARNVADTAASGVRTYKPGKYTAGAGVVGGGYLYWREQDVRKVESMADQAESWNDMTGDVIDSDLPPEVKQQIIEQLLNEAGGGGDGDDDSAPNPLSFLDDLFPGGGVESTILMVVIVVVVLSWVLNKADGITAPPTPAGAAAGAVR